MSAYARFRMDLLDYASTRGVAPVQIARRLFEAYPRFPEIEHAEIAWFAQSGEAWRVMPSNWREVVEAQNRDEPGWLASVLEPLALPPADDEPPPLEEEPL